MIKTLFANDGADIPESTIFRDSCFRYEKKYSSKGRCKYLSKLIREKRALQLDIILIARQRSAL